MRPYSLVLAYTGDDYGINRFQGADDDDDMDRLETTSHSDTGEEFVRRGTTTKLKWYPQGRACTPSGFDEDDFTLGSITPKP